MIPGAHHDRPIWISPDLSKLNDLDMTKCPINDLEPHMRPTYNTSNLLMFNMEHRFRL